MEPEGKNGRIDLRPYSMKELAALYGVRTKTVKTWLKPFAELIGQRFGRYYTIKQVETIFDKIGVPHTISL